MQTNSPDILEQCCAPEIFEELSSIRSAKIASLDRAHWSEVQELFKRLPQDSGSKSEAFKVVEDSIIDIDSDGRFDESEQEKLKELVQSLIPWRKGPFSIGGTEINAEWRSDCKWERIRPILGDLRNRRILDVGCGNGYYMFRAAAEGCHSVLGFDPSELFYFQFQLAQYFARSPRLQYEMFGLEHCSNLESSFDIVMCMGVLYHQRNPLSALKTLGQPLRKGGLLLLETQVIPGNGPHCLFPPKRYAKARNVFFVPTADSLCAWLARSGYSDIEIHSSVRINFEEQRRTELAPYESLEDFLDPNDETLTVEGHPAPLRAVVTARKQ